MSSIDMNEMGTLVRKLALAFVAECGPNFLSMGKNGSHNIALPLTRASMSNMLQYMVVEQVGSVHGADFALAVLRSSLHGDMLSDSGYELVCALLEGVCEEFRPLIAKGKDPAVEIDRLRTELEGRARV